jgi:acyl-CoA synthetase (AMP-forming)/AMP-acid ligase II
VCVRRLKELIKVKAFQVVPVELEAVLLAHPDIADARVIGVPDDEAEEVPMAFIVAAGERRLTLDELDACFEGQLAHYKRVRRVEYIDGIPKSASGKILRRLLRGQHAQAA